MFLPISDLTAANFYFSGFLFGASALLLLALYFFRWKSEVIDLLVWSTAIFCAGWFSRVISGHAEIPFASILAILIFVAMGRALIPVISLFGLFFLISMLIPTLYGLIWLFELSHSLSSQLNAGWALYGTLILISLIISVVAIFNTAMGSWYALTRFADLYFLFPRARNGWQQAEKVLQYTPFVSVHVPCYSEPPDMVIETLNALAKQTYPHFEVILLDNNTRDPNLWKPVEEHCKKLGDRFRFFHFDAISGAKAGALNKALQLTSPQAELISVVDSDYVAQPDFLERCTGFFADPKTGFLQTCQDYREWENSTYKRGCYFEYEMFFKLELPGISEWDAAYTIGTMCLIRRKALEEIGGWADWCLTEDSEVAVRLHAAGYSGYFLKDTFGKGLIPETFEDYKIQRFRWSAGPVQQIQRHWRLYLPWCVASRLTFIQKQAEIFHSLSTFFSEALNVFIALPLLAICLWLAITKQQAYFLPPSILLLLPIAIVRNQVCRWIHIRLLGGSWRDMFYSSLASRSLIYTRNKAFCMAWLPFKLAWKRTEKFKASTSFKRAFSSCRTESALGVAYVIFVGLAFPFATLFYPDMICLILLGFTNQGLSFFAAPVMAYLSEKVI